MRLARLRIVGDAPGEREAARKGYERGYEEEGPNTGDRNAPSVDHALPSLEMISSPRRKR